MKNAKGLISLEFMTVSEIKRQPWCTTSSEKKHAFLLKVSA